jgi:hypothetical protein
LIDLTYIKNKGQWTRNLTKTFGNIGQRKFRGREQLFVFVIIVAMKKIQLIVDLHLRAGAPFVPAAKKQFIFRNKKSKNILHLDRVFKNQTFHNSAFSFSFFFTSSQTAAKHDFSIIERSHQYLR